MTRPLAILAAMMLTACAAKDNGVRVSQQPSVPKAAPQPVAAEPMRTEPIFYNGKTYQLKFAPAGKGQFAMSVHGMGPKQQKDAVNVATSSLRYFKCKDGQNGLLTSGPVFADAAWKMTARCG